MPKSSSAAASFPAFKSMQDDEWSDSSGSILDCWDGDPLPAKGRTGHDQAPPLLAAPGHRREHNWHSKYQDAIALHGKTQFVGIRCNSVVYNFMRSLSNELKTYEEFLQNGGTPTEFDSNAAKSSRSFTSDKVAMARPLVFAFHKRQSKKSTFKHYAAKASPRTPHPLAHQRKRAPMQPTPSPVAMTTTHTRFGKRATVTAIPPSSPAVNPPFNAAGGVMVSRAAVTPPSSLVVNSPFNTAGVMVSRDTNCVNPGNQKLFEGVVDWAHSCFNIVGVVRKNERALHCGKHWYDAAKGIMGVRIFAVVWTCIVVGKKVTI